MTPQQFYDTYKGQSLLYSTNQADRGQCVQAVCFYVKANNKPVIWADAYKWFTNSDLAYDRITNSATAVPQVGDIIVWGPSLPNSGGAGHIAVCFEPRPGTGTFVSIDSNWNGKTVQKITHNYNYVLGWLRFKGAPQPNQQGADEMIANADQATKIYKILRPNGGASQDEINATAGKRSFAEFINSAQPEVAVRDAQISQQAAQAQVGQNATQQLATMQKNIDTLYENVKNLTDDNDSLKKMVADLGGKNEELKTELAAKKEAEPASASTAPPPNWFTKWLAKFIKS